MKVVAIRCDSRHLGRRDGLERIEEGSRSATPKSQIATLLGQQQLRHRKSPSVAPGRALNRRPPRLVPDWRSAGLIALFLADCVVLVRTLENYPGVDDFRQGHA